MHHGDSRQPHCLLQSLYDVLRTVADGKYPIAPFGFQRNAQLFEISHDVLRGAAGKRTVQEFPVGRDICHQGVAVTVVGEIAATFAGDAKLASQLFVVFQNDTAFAVFGGGQCRKDTCRSAADA